VDTRQEVKSLKKALRVLTFMNRMGESTVTQVAKSIAVPRTTAYRLLETLASEGYVERQPHSDIYRLTSLVQKLSAGFGEDDLVIEVAKPLIAQFGAELRLPIALATPRGCDMVVRIATDHDAPIVIDRFVIGFAVPMLRAPTGFCYLAHCDEFAKQKALALSRERGIGPDQMGFDFQHFEYLLGRIRAEGFYDMRFREYREAGVAIPLTISDRVFGGIVMRYVKSAVKPVHVEREFAPRLRALGEEIGQAFQARLLSQDTARAMSATEHLQQAYALA
jgi:IclR family mhp operon transcriptional activator